MYGLVGMWTKNFMQIEPGISERKLESWFLGRDPATYPSDKQESQSSTFVRSFQGSGQRKWDSEENRN